MMKPIFKTNYKDGYVIICIHKTLHIFFNTTLLRPSFSDQSFLNVFTVYKDSKKTRRLLEYESISSVQKAALTESILQIT